MPPPPDARLTVEVHPRAGRNAIVGWRGAVLRVRVAAPPADGAANLAVRRLLAERLDCAPSRVEIVRGHAARTKVVRIAGLAAGEITGRLGMPGAQPSAPAPSRSA
jgi:uncharacterized protein (TIGR00251 family)